MKLNSSTYQVSQTEESVEDDLPLRHQRRIYLIANYHTNLQDHRRARISSSPRKDSVLGKLCSRACMYGAVKRMSRLVSVHCVSVPRQALEVTSLDWFCKACEM